MEPEDVAAELLHLASPDKPAPPRKKQSLSADGNPISLAAMLLPLLGPVPAPASAAPGASEPPAGSAPLGVPDSVWSWHALTAAALGAHWRPSLPCLRLS